MKNLILAFVTICTFGFGATLSAQSMASADTKSYTSPTTDKVEIIDNFEATKAQAKLIKKIQKYVTPRVLGRNTRTAMLEGKVVNIQMGLDDNGLIEYVVAYDGIEPKINNRVVKLVKEYNEKKPFTGADVNKPTILQMAIPVTRKKNYMDY
ncbi:MAG: hypothetical protein AAF960_21380 [Bacteroidota bacterium]